MSRLECLIAAAGPGGWIDPSADPASAAAYLREWRGQAEGGALGIARPASVEAVQAVVRAAALAGIALVPQGGNTGLVGASVARAGERAIIVSLNRLTRIRALDPAGFTLTADAGVTLAAARAAAEAEGRLLPLWLGSGGSATLGGLAATDAGGTMTIRYGTMRDLVLGLEVVLPDGRLWSGLAALRKDTAGYDLKQWFIGAEGTLGLITGVTVALAAQPRSVVTALVALPDPMAALRLLATLRAAVGDRVVAFELMGALPARLPARHLGLADPFAATPPPWRVLVELHDTPDEALLRVLEATDLTQAVLAGSQAQAAALWHAREAIPQAEKHEAPVIRHDVAVPVTHVPRLLEEGIAAMRAVAPEGRPFAFGHVGDGNMHFHWMGPEGALAEPARAAFLAHAPAVTRALHDVALRLDGTIAAEHGIGRFKRAELARTHDPVALDLMRALKAALDPAGRMNPGAIL